MSILPLLAALAVSLFPTTDPTHLVNTETIGTSRDGRPLELLVLADPIETAHERPGILIVAGLDGQHRLGPALARAIAERLGVEHADLLSETTFYVLPLINPDGAADAHRHGTTRVIDQDRDGLIDEDPPRDLDGNGVITMMRRADPPLGDPPTHLQDPADDRLMITPDPSKGERATHTLYIEGIDADDDGLIGEDGPEGIDLQRNFMHRWPEYDPDSGPFPLSEYESSALARFILSRPNLIAAVVYGPHDNLIREPDTKGKDITGRNPKELSGDDLEAHKKVAERYKALVGQERSSNIDSAGSLHGWLYAYRGVPTFASTGWGRPNPSEPEEGEEGLEPRDKEDGLWLAYSDRDRNGDGFVEWTAYDHPQLGAVEIGGWVPGFKSMPPPDSMNELVAGHTSWLAELAGERAILEVTDPEIETIGGGMTKIRIGVRNVGATATRSRQATRNRANRPTNIRLDCDPGQVIEGRMLTQIELIKPGELVTVEWTVRLRPGEPIAIEIDDPVLATNVVHNVEVDR